MKLLKCHIENFGKISDFNYEFKDGLNEILENNGWGKTTFAVFLKVMFYGFENDNSRDEIKNERRRYKPWQKGTYGGTIDFETNNKTYTMTRIFSDKDKDDSFEIRFRDTLLVCNDFSERIGEELFGIDRESFSRTVFIRDNECHTNVNGSINAKIGNLVDNTDDINNYEKVSKELKDRLNQKSPSLKRGSLKQLKDEISSIKEKVKNIESIENNIANLVGDRNQCLNEQKNLKIEREEINKTIELISKYKDNKAKKEEYRRLSVSCEEREKNYEDISSVFPGKIPSKEEIDSMISESSQLVELNGRLNSLTLFSESEQEDFDCKLKEIETKYDNKLPTNEMISILLADWTNYISILGGLTSKKTTCQLLQDKENEKILEQQKKEEKKKKNILIIGMIAFFFAVVLMVFGIQTNTNIAFIISGICVITGVVFTINFAQTKKQSSNYVKEDTEQIKELNKEIISDEEFLNATRNKVNNVFEQMGLNFDEKSVNQELYNIQNDIRYYNELKEKSETKKKQYSENKINYENVRKAYEEKTSIIKSYINDLQYECREDLYLQLIEIKDNITKVNAAKLELEKIRKEKEQFETENSDYTNLNMLEEIEDLSLEECEEKNNNIINRLEQLHKSINSYDIQIDDWTRKRDEFEELKSDLKLKEEQYETGLVEYKDLKLTKEFLDKAKGNLVNKYTTPIQKGIDKYFSLIVGSKSNIKVDGNLDLITKEQGLLKNILFFSHGYRDLAGICMRMALVDAMYQGEKPFIIFDDPFVNLDTQKVNGGKILLNEIGKEYQIIHFTCHSSRSSSMLGN